MLIVRGVLLEVIRYSLATLSLLLLGCYLEPTPVDLDRLERLRENYGQAYDFQLAGDVYLKAKAKKANPRVMTPRNCIEHFGSMARNDGKRRTSI